MQPSGQIDVEQGVELADPLEQSDPATVVKRAGDGDRPGNVRCSIGIEHGRCEAVEKFVRRCVRVDGSPSHTAGYQQTGALVHEGRGDVCATYLQCPDQVQRLRHGVASHRKYAFTTRTVLWLAAGTVTAPAEAQAKGAASPSDLSFLFMP